MEFICFDWCNGLGKVGTGLCLFGLAKVRKLPGVGGYDFMGSPNEYAMKINSLFYYFDSNLFYTSVFS